MILRQEDGSRAVDERVMLAMALLVVPALAIEQSALDGVWNAVAVVLNWVTWSAFLVEATLAVATSTDPRGWLRDHPLEVAIVVLTPPFLPAALQAARLFRLLRLLRLARAGILLRRLLSTEGIRDAGVLALMTVLGGGVAFAAVEGRGLSSWDGVWWAITTVTTVGYGDITPETDGGRAIAVAVMVVGIGFVAVLTAAAADRFIRGTRLREREELLERLDDVAARVDAIAERQGLIAPERWTPPPR